ncbi:Uncharacterised protein [Neisseria meningitidis]|nr:Uncharacterised protein [Neisseria meningitidis]
MPCSPRWIWRRQQGTARLEPKPVRLRASLSVRRWRRHRWRFGRRAGRQARCLPKRYARCGGRGSAGRCRRRAYGRTNTARRSDANRARICAGRRFGCRNSRRLCRNGGFAPRDCRREIRRLSFSDDVYRRRVKVVPTNSTICAHHRRRYSRVIFAHPFQS